MSLVLPEMTPMPGESLYLLVDGGQIKALAKQLYSIDGPLALEHIYMFEPYDQLMAVSPYLIQATPEVQDWFAQQSQRTEGFFLSSPLKLEALADHFRQFIKVHPPYGGLVFFKMAHSEASWVLLNTSTELYWQSISYVWCPTREGLQQMHNPFPQGNSRSNHKMSDWLTLSDQQWQQLGDITWRNTLEHIQAHLAQWFPETMNRQGSPLQWLNRQARLAYQRGMTTERDLLLYFNIIGYLGEHAVTDTDAYPDIYQLLTQPSEYTPTQRVDQAEILAEHYAKQEQSS